MRWSHLRGGRRGGVHNWAGRLGAWLADGSYFALGFSVVGCGGGRVCWLAAWRAGSRAGETPRPTPDVPPGGGACFLGWAAAAAGQHGAGVVAPGTVLSRHFRAMPGLLGYWLGPVSMQWLGFTGSGAGGHCAGGGLRWRWCLASRGAFGRALGARIRPGASGRAPRELDAWPRASALRASAKWCLRSARRSRPQHPAGADHRAGVGRGAPEHPWAKGTPETPVHRCCPTAACRRWTCSTAPRSTRRWFLPKPWDDQPPHREKAQDFGVDVTVVAAIARPGDHALRDQARHRRQRARRW